MKFFHYDKKCTNEKKMRIKEIFSKKGNFSITKKNSNEKKSVQRKFFHYEKKFKRKKKIHIKQCNSSEQSNSSRAISSSISNNYG